MGDLLASWEKTKQGNERGSYSTIARLKGGGDRALDSRGTGIIMTDWRGVPDIVLR